MVEACLQVVMTLVTTMEINGVFQRMGMVMSFLEIILCWYGKKNYGWNTTHVTNFHNAYKPSHFCLPNTYPCMKSHNKSNETSPDLTPTSLIYGNYHIVSTRNSTGSSSSTTNGVSPIKYYDSFAGLNKLKTQSMNQDIVELAIASALCLI